MKNVVKISRGTEKKEELFDYANIPSYLKISKKNNKKDLNYYEINL